MARAKLPDCNTTGNRQKSPRFEGYRAILVGIVGLKDCISLTNLQESMRYCWLHNHIVTWPRKNDQSISTCYSTLGSNDKEEGGGFGR